MTQPVVDTESFAERYKRLRNSAITNPSLPVEQPTSEFGQRYNRIKSQIAAPIPSQAPTPQELAEDDYLRTQTSWSFWGATRGTGRTIARIPVRFTEDMYNAANDVFLFGKKARWDDKWLGKPQNAVEDITADIGSFLVSFLLPGGAVAKAGTTTAKLAGGGKVLTKLSKTSKGRKAVKFTKIVGEGAVAGAVADYLSTDTGDETGMVAVQERLSNVVKGGFIGAGVNLTGHGLARTVGIGIKKIRALKKVKLAAEGKGDPVVALQSLKKALDEENALKSDVAQEIQKTDEVLKPVDLNNLSKETDGTLPKQADEFEVAPEKAASDKAKTTKEESTKKKEVEEPTPEKALLDIDEYIKRGANLPEQVNRLIRLNFSIAEEVNPRILSLSKKIEDFSKRTPTNAEIDTIRELVGEMELSLHRYKKIMELRARAGNITGKLLRSFRGDTKIDFTKSFTYKPEVLKRRRQIDSLLEFVQGTKNGKITDDTILEGIKKQIGELVDIESGKSLSDVVSESFGKTRDEATESIWSRYQKDITERVSKELLESSPKNKAAMEEFSGRVTKTLTDAVKVDKPVTKILNKALRESENILGNPEKYRDTINKLIKDITDSESIKAVNKDKAINTLNDILSGQQGKTLFESLPQRQELVKGIIKEELKNIGTTVAKAVKEGRESEVLEEVLTRIGKKSELNDFQKNVLIQNVRVELANAITDIRDDIIRKFISKELYQKVGLREQLKELDEMGDKSIEEIRQYLASVSKDIKKTPEDIASLKKEVASARKELETQSKNAYIKELLNKLTGFQDYQGTGSDRWELFMQVFEKFRLNNMLSSVKTWVVGIPTAGFNLAYQPLHRAIKTYTTERGKLVGGQATRAEAFRMAMAEIKATSEYFSNWKDIFSLMKETWKNQGRSGFNPKSFRRHEEDLADAAPILNEPLKLAFKDRKRLKELVQRYGQDTPDNSKRLDRLLEELATGETHSAVGKLLDPLFSISFRFMGFLDEPFKYVGTMRALRSSATQEGLQKGLVGKELDTFVTKRMGEAVTQKDGLPMWAKKEEFNEIEELGLSITYQEKYADKAISNLAKAFSNFSRTGDDAYYNPLKIAMRLSVPFIKTPTAIAQWTIDNLPVYAQSRAVLLHSGRSSLHRQLKKTKESLQDAQNIFEKGVTPEQKKEALENISQLNKETEDLNLKIIEATADATATAITSTVVQIGITTAIATGSITGTGSYLTDDQKRRLIHQGWRPNSIKIGNKWFNYGRFEPWSTYLSMQADFIHWSGIVSAYGTEGLKEDQSLANVLHASFVENLSNKYFIRGLHEMIRPIVDEDARIEDTFVNYVSSLSPRIIRDLATMNESFQTEAVDWQSKMKERMLGINPGQYSRNLLGEKVERVWSQEGAFGLISPMVVSDLKDDKILNEIASVHGTLGQSRVYNRESIDTRKYRSSTNQTLYDSWMSHMSTFKIRGKNMRKTLGDLFKSREYINAPLLSSDGLRKEKRQYISETISKYRTAAWKDMKKKRKFNKDFYNKEGILWTDRVYSKDIESKDVPDFLELIDAK